MIFIIIYLVWFISEIFINISRRSGNKNGQDKGTKRFIWITIAIANSLGVIFAKTLYFPVGSSIIIPYSGLIVIVLGMIFRFIAIWTLGRFFTVDVTIRENHKLKRDGLYNILRHPSYSGSVLSFIGFGLSLNNWLSLFIVSVSVTMAMLRRINVEEKLLTDQFGTEYKDYIKHTYRLIPWVY